MPKVLISEVERVMNAYWWGNKSGGGRGIRWMAWQYLCVSKRWEGMGFRSLREFNVAMLSKQAWRIIQNPLSLMARIYKAKYFPNQTFLQARKGNNPSFILSSIIESQEVIRRSCRWRVGNGKDINVWDDPWLPDHANPKVQSGAHPELQAAKVSSLMDVQSQGWDEDVLNDLFCQRDIFLIKSIPLPNHSCCDKLIWAKEDHGKFSVKTCYRAMVGEIINEDRLEWRSMWKFSIPPKFKVFFLASL